MTKFTCIIAQERVFSNLLKYLWLLLHIKPHRKLFSIFFSTFEKVDLPLIDNIYKKICRTSRSCRRLQCNIFCLPRRLEDVLKTYLQDALQTRLEDVLKTYLQDVLQTRLEDVLKTSWKRFGKTYCNTSWKMKSVTLKTSWKTRNVCWDILKSI